MAEAGELVLGGGGVTYYETLGVSPDATPEEIKRAYRAKASKLHPDREGGSDDAMRELNVAYECLSNDDRRTMYDRTGVDAVGDARNQRLRSLIMDAFNNMLATKIDHNEMLVVTNYVRTQREKLLGQQRETEAERKRLERKRDKIRRRDGVNLFHMLVDQHITALTQGLEELKEDLAICDEAVEMLKTYEGDAGAAVAGFLGAGMAPNQGPSILLEY